MRRPYNDKVLERGGVALQVRLNITWVERSRYDALVCVTACKLHRKEDVHLERGVRQYSWTDEKRGWETYKLALCIQHLLSDLLALRSIPEGIEVYREEHVAGRRGVDDTSFEDWVGFRCFDHQRKQLLREVEVSQTIRPELQIVAICRKLFDWRNHYATFESRLQYVSDRRQDG